jgi:PBP1b-binding outer membrane lipoprotein LpoB
MTCPRRLSGVALSGVLCLALLVASIGCAPRAMRGGEGTANPDLDAPALSVTLDREDINYLVADYLARLEPSPFWKKVESARTPPLVAIWPIMNATSQHIDDQMLTLLSSIETALVNTGDVRVVARASQEDLAREIGIQHGPAFDPATARRLGRQLGAQYYFTGKVTSVDEKLSKLRRVQYSLFLQVVEVETGLILFQNEVTRSKAVQR